VPAFGRVISYAICYRETFSVRHALDGTELEVLDHPVPLPGEAWLATIH
jgi:hypothetical protein